MNQRFCNGMIHVIKTGDNLYQLSRKYRVPLALILRANPYVDVYNLRPGQEICIPMRRPMMQGPGQQPENQPGQPPQGQVPPPPQGQVPPPPQPRGEQMEEGQMESVADVCAESTGSSYYCDGTKSLGEILQETEITMEELWENNDPEKVVPAADVVLQMPKRV